MSENNDNAKHDSKTPKRVLHFSDGVLEEEDETEDHNLNESNGAETDGQIVSKKWPVISVVVNSMLWFGSQTLKVCDYLGESLADFFGITSPKYEYEIEEYNRRLEEEKKREEFLKSEFEGWTQQKGTEKVIQFGVKSVDALNDSNPNVDNKKNSSEFSANNSIV